MVLLDQIESLILSALRELAEDFAKPELASAGPETVLFGAGGILDSLALVQLIAELEARVSEEFGRDIVIADERAMSRSRSPFRSVATLRDYLGELVGEEGGGC
jgi:acyl carrier protein